MVDDNCMNVVQDLALIRLLYLSHIINKKQVKKIKAEYKQNILDSPLALEDHLVKSYGVKKSSIGAVKKACWEENTFGKVLESYLKRTGGLSKGNYTKFKDDIEQCVIEQKEALNERDFPLPIGELMAQKGWLKHPEINVVLKEQGTIDKIRYYVREEAIRDSFLSKQGFFGEGYNLKKGKLAVCSLAILLGLAAGYNTLRPKPTSVELVIESVQDQKKSEKRASYSAMVQASYSNMLENVKRKDFDNAQDNLNEIKQYFGYVNSIDPEMEIENPDKYNSMKEIFDKTLNIDFSKVEEIEDVKLRQMKTKELERLVVQ